MATTTKLSPAEKKELIALGATLGEIRDLQEEGYAFAEMQEVCRGIAERKEADQQAQADRNAKATKRAMRPENETHPGVSVFNPAGDVARPRPELRCKMFWTGVPLEQSTLTYDEIERLNKLTPGAYRCMKGDGTPFEIRVEAERDTATGQVDKLKVNFRVRGYDKHNHLGMLAYLDQMLEQATGLVGAHA